MEQNSSLKHSVDNYTNNIYNRAGFGVMGIPGNNNPYLDTHGNILDHTTLREDWLNCTGDNDLVYIKDKDAGMFGGDDPYALAGQTHNRNTARYLPEALHSLLPCIVRVHAR